MISYRDFVPATRKGAKWFHDPTYETFDAAVDAANAWIRSEAVDVTSIETVVLPNISEPTEEGTDEGQLNVIRGYATWHQFLRVWYKT